MTFTRLISTFFGVGLLRPASGTWGSLAALAIGVMVHRIGHFPVLALATLIVIPVGFWAIDREVAGRTNKDPSEIVIDEVAGQWLALLFPSAAFYVTGAASTVFPWPAWVAAFVFFRLFDIWKPGPIGRADRRGDAKGVMIDDLWAGLFAGCATLIAAGLAHSILLQM